jgi:hypothetical protein
LPAPTQRREELDPTLPADDVATPRVLLSQGAEAFDEDVVATSEVVNARPQSQEDQTQIIKRKTVDDTLEVLPQPLRGSRCTRWAESVATPLLDLVGGAVEESISKCSALVIPCVP